MAAPALSAACAVALPRPAAPLRARRAHCVQAAAVRGLTAQKPALLRRSRPARAVRPAAFFGRKEAAGGGGSATAGALALCPAAVALPHPAKLAKGGEDAHFIRVSPAGGMLALADGVSGFQDQGIDASLYSRKLLRTLADASQGIIDDAAAAPADTLALLAEAQNATREPGASTAVVLSLEGRTGTLRGTHVGDSGFRVLRAGAVVHASQPQQHDFDCPLQLGCKKYIPDTDTADAGITTEVALQAGDLLLVASDGLFDNVNPDEMLQIAAEALGAEPPGADGAGAYAAAARVAASLAAVAKEHSGDKAYDSPYARDAKRDSEQRRAAAGPLGAFAAAFGRGGDEPQPGGKLDDITVMAAIVIPASGRAADAELAAASAAAAAALQAVPSAVGDAEQEGRATVLFATEADEVAANMAVKAAAAAERAAAFLPAFDAGDVAAMDATALRKALAAKGLPTSGKLEALRARLAAVPA